MGYTTDDPDAERALRSPTARTVLDAVQKRPGASLTQLRRSTGLGWGTLYHHLARLQRAGLVTLEKHGRLRRAFLRGGGEVEVAPVGGHHGRTRRRVAATIARGPTTVEALVRETGLSRRVVYHHAKRLIDAGLVERARDRSLQALPGLARLLEE